MHRCLCVDEIARLVIKDIIKLEVLSAISLACTCRAFEAAVMEILWGSHQTNLVTLLRCLPNEVWEIRKSDLGGSYFDFRRCPSPSEWERVDRYAGWMQTLNVYEDGIGPRLSSKAWGELSLKAARLLPNLHSLEWYSAPDTFIYINLFPTPRLTPLRVLRVRVTPNIPNVVLILALLPVEALEEMRFLNHSGDRAVQDAISGLVLCTRAALRSIEVSSDLSDAAIRHLARLPNLTDASVGFANPDGRVAASNTFPSLRSLETKADGKGGWKYLLGHGDRLESIVLLSPTVLRPGEVADVFGFLVSRGLHRTIRLLSFASVEPYDLTPLVLAPLLKFGCLTRLSVTSPSCNPGRCTSRLTDDALGRLAEALPQLVELFLGNIPCGSPAPGITLAGLFPLSIHCLQLETLQVHFSALDIPTKIPDGALSKPSDQMPLAPNHCRLVRIVVGRLPIASSGKPLLSVAFFLHQMFPMLSKIVHTTRDSPWRDVQGHLEVFQKYRPKKVIWKGRQSRR